MTPGRDDLLAGIEPGSVQALVEGRHGDAFSILGPHPASGGSIVRVFMPGAKSVEVLRRGKDSESDRLHLVHGDGLFAGRLDHQDPYTLRVHWPDAVQE